MDLSKIDVSKMSPAEKRELLALLEIKQQLEDQTKLFRYAPYAKQREFHAASSKARERLFMAGNQLGKTWAGAYEIAMHLTGEYPDWWVGRRFPQGVRVLCGSESGELTRKGVQRLLVGTPEDEQAWGTGTIPKKNIKSYHRKTGVPNALDSMVISHKSGKTSTIQFNSYDQGRSKWQADTVDIVWFDEEPPPDLYFEGLTRTNATGGMVMVTFTPLLGMSEVVRRFIVEKAPNTMVINMTIEDAEHYTPEERQAIIDSYPPHEREARAKGVPMLGSGRIFPVAEDAIKVAGFPIPRHWARIVGMDFGWDHYTAAGWLAWDRDADVVYLTEVYRVKEQPVMVHASSIRARGQWIPVAWPHDGLQHDKGSGVQLAQQYKDHGLNMLSERATFTDGSNGVEAGISDMLDRMRTGRFKVFSHCLDFFEEFRMYHRKDGKIVKENDDAISAVRYGLMMLRHAVTADDVSYVPQNQPMQQMQPFQAYDSVAGY